MLTKAEIQHLRSLQEKKQREALGLFIVEGDKVVAELLQEGRAFEAIYVTPAYSGPLLREARRISPEEMARISHFPTPSGVLAVGKLLRPSLEKGELEQGFTLALDGVQDAGNVGTLLRIADWFGFERVLLSPDCADLFSQKVINASMGSFGRVRAVSVSLDVALHGLPVPVLGCELSGTPLHQIAPLRAAVVVIGSEGRGLSPAVKAVVSQAITIPRYGYAESLNAGVAAGIVCEALARGRVGSTAM